MAKKTKSPTNSNDTVRKIVWSPMYCIKCRRALMYCTVHVYIFNC